MLPAGQSGDFAGNLPLDAAQVLPLLLRKPAKGGVQMPVSGV